MAVIVPTQFPVWMQVPGRHAMLVNDPVSYGVAVAQGYACNSPLLVVQVTPVYADQPAHINVIQPNTNDPSPLP